VKRNTSFNRTTPIASCCALVGLLVAASACSSSTDNGTTDGGAAGGTATFTEVYTTIISPNCLGCHDSGTKAGNLDMSTQSVAFMNLVGVPASGPSCLTVNEDRVTAGSPSQSVFYSKISASMPVCGNEMPLGGPFVSAADVTLVSEWITDGALNN
jgi:hypothetical protein